MAAAHGSMDTKWHQIYVFYDFKVSKMDNFLRIVPSSAVTVLLTVSGLFCDFETINETEVE